MSTMNRLWNVTNPYQGKDLKILTVCSAGLLRSPTLARWLHRNFKNVNTRPVGTSQDHALISLDEVHLRWAEVILCVDSSTFNIVEDQLNTLGVEREIHSLNIPDNFGFGDETLENIIKVQIEELLKEVDKQTKEEIIFSDLSLLKRV